MSLGDKQLLTRLVYCKFSYEKNWLILWIYFLFAQKNQIVSDTSYASHLLSRVFFPQPLLRWKLVREPNIICTVFCIFTLRLFLWCGWDICEQLLIMFGCSKLQVWGNEHSLVHRGTWLFGDMSQVMDMCYPRSPQAYSTEPQSVEILRRFQWDQILVFWSGDHSDNTPLFGLSLLLYLPSLPLLIPGIMSLSKVLPIKLPLSLQCPLTFLPFLF